MRGSSAGEQLTVVPPLVVIALAAVRDHVLSGNRLVMLSLLPSELAHRLLGALVSRLPREAHSAPASCGSRTLPPPELLRLFYGGKLERLRLAGASDEIVGEVFGGGLHGLKTLQIGASPHLTAYGAGHLAVALSGTLVELTLRQCTSIGAEAVAQLCACKQLHTCRLLECDLALDACGAAPVLTLPRLTELDLGGNPLTAEAAAVLCTVDGERPLRTLRLWGSYADDDAAMAAMSLTCLETLDLSWSRLSADGLQALALGIGGQLRELHIGNAPRLEPGSVEASLAALPSLVHLSLAGLKLSVADLTAVAHAHELTRLDLSGARILEGAGRHAAFHALGHRLRLFELNVEGLGGGGGTEDEEEGDLGGEASTETSTGNERAATLIRVESTTRSVDGVQVMPPPPPAPPRQLRLCASGCSFLQSAMSVRAALGWLTITTEALRTLQVRGCPAFVAALARRQPHGLPALAELDISATDSNNDTLAWVSRCKRLTALDVSSNGQVDDSGAHALLGLRRTLQTLSLRDLPRLTAGALDTLRQMSALRTVTLQGTSIPTHLLQSLPSQARATASAQRAEASLASLLRGSVALSQDAQTDAMTPQAAAEPQRYDAAEMLALRSSAYSQLPPRPLPSLPGILLSE